MGPTGWEESTGRTEASYAARVPANSVGCKWHIHGVNPNSAGIELYSGGGQPGENLRAAITPGVHASAITGELDGGWRVVFMTNGYGAWELER